MTPLQPFFRVQEANVEGDDVFISPFKQKTKQYANDEVLSVKNESYGAVFEGISVQRPCFLLQDSPPSGIHS